MSAPEEVEDLDHDPEFDQMRDLGRVCVAVARRLLAGDITGREITRAVEEPDRHLVPAALVIIKEFEKAGVLNFRDPGPIMIYPARIGHA